MHSRVKQAMQALKATLHSLWTKTAIRWPLLRQMKQCLWKKRETTTDTDASLLFLKRGVMYKGLLAAAALVLAVVMMFAMTAAWYKNVVQTSGLLFHVDQWGLDSSVNIQDELIDAAPGDSGTINLSVDNTSDGVIDVTFGISKGDLYNDIADMRKRLYFYIDDMAYRGGEHTPRVYLNSAETYSYTVLPSQNLVLGTNGNAAPLMWEWVFDVVGYYFYGTVTKESKAQVSEYLRPVEYTLDKATFRNGVLQTVDGTTTPAAFIEELSDNDGFAGIVTTTVTASDGRVYYPVSVDAEGQGVWIYLCNLGEIEYETMVDTNLGSAKADTDRQFETYLHVTAQQKQLTVAQVSTADQLAAALNDNINNMVQLTGNVVLTDTLTVFGTSEKILDLGGYTLSTNAAQLVLVEEGASLSVMDGTLQGAGTASCYGVVVEGGDVAMGNVVITDTAQGVRISDDAAAYNDSRVTLTGCEIHSTTAGVLIKGNGPVTSADTCLVIEDSLIECNGYYALSGNGTVGAKGNYGTNILIRNSTLRAINSAIYHPQRDSTLTIEGSVLEGITPVAIKGGSVSITDTAITALSGDEYADDIADPGFANNGYTKTGAGVYVETNYNYPCSVTIGGDSTVTAVYAHALLQYESHNPLYTITVTGGKYSHDVSAFLADGYTCVKEGNYWLVKKR